MAEPPAASTPYVFLSYASTDRARTFAVADALEAAGITVWVDRRDIAGGSSWDTAIVDGISHCAVFALACTPASLASPNVQQEVRLAWEEQRPILPLLLDQTPIPRELRYPLAGRQWVELLDRAEAAWLSDVVRALAGLGVVPSSAPTTSVLTPALAASAPTNLPTALTRILGREQELVDLARLLAENRLVTLTGPGGTGKTRLAIGAAAVQTAAFPDGIFFVDLAPLADPTLVPTAVAQSLSVPTFSELPVRDSVLRFVRDKQLLLVLDNYEHLLAAVEFAGALLQAAPELTLLVTSRAPLRVPGEREYPVASLPLPQGALGTAAELGASPAVALFVLRARDVRPEFTLTDDNAPTVAAICTRLDGLPLAIELAAARIRVLPPLALLARLTERLPLLTGGARTVPARQQTLRGAIVWSYDLLEPTEQVLFRRLGVFAGGCTLELAEAVCNANGDLGFDVLDGVSSLVEKSLLRETDGTEGEPRYRMLETIREFALGELEVSGEAQTLRQQLALQVLQLARQCATAGNWTRLDVDLDNARAVLGWCVARGELAVGERLFWALRLYFWNHHGGQELEEWSRRLLALPEAALPSVTRARLLAHPTRALLTTAQQVQYAAELEEAIGLCRELGDTACLAHALQCLGMLRLQQARYSDARPLMEEALALALRRGASAIGLRRFLSDIALAHGDVTAAERLYRANQADAGPREAVHVLRQAAMLAEARGDDAHARVLWEEHQRGASEREERIELLLGLAPLALVALRQGDSRAALDACRIGLAMHHAQGPSRFLPFLLTALAKAAEGAGLLGVGARLLAVSEAQRTTFAVELSGFSAAHDAAVERVRAALDEVAFAEAWAAGEALSADAAIEYGLDVVTQLEQVLATDAIAGPRT